MFGSPNNFSDAQAIVLTITTYAGYTSLMPSGQLFMQVRPSESGMTSIPHRWPLELKVALSTQLNHARAHANQRRLEFAIRM
jgi:hypothetical protein